LLFKFIVNIQTAQNVITYRHSPRNSLSCLLSDSSCHTCSRRHPHWPIRSEWPTATDSPTLHAGGLCHSSSNVRKFTLWQEKYGK